MRPSSSSSSISSFSSLNAGSPPSSPSRTSDPIPLKKTVVIHSQNVTAYRANPSPDALERMSKVQLCPWLKYKGDLTTINTSLSQISREQPILKSSSSSSDKREMLILGDSYITLYRFIVTVEGQLICATNNPDFEEYSHSSMVERADTEHAPYLLAAGELGLNELGKLTFVSNRTGHYRIPLETLRGILLPCLEAHGFSVEDLQQLYVRFCSIDTPEGSEPAQSFSDYTSSPYANYFNGELVSERKEQVRESKRERAKSLSLLFSSNVETNLPYANSSPARGVGIFTSVSSAPSSISQSADSSAANNKKRKREDSSLSSRSS